MVPPNFDSMTEEAIVSRLEIQRSLGRVEGKLDQIISGMTEHEARDQIRFAEVALQVKDLETQIESIKKKIWVWSGAIAVIAFVLSHFPFTLFTGK
jgi:septation ring formation regulator EzrA